MEELAVFDIKYHSRDSEGSQMMTFMDSPLRYTGHCPTLKFRVGKRYGACTGEIIKELIEQRVLKTGPNNKSGPGSETLVPIPREKDIRRDWKKDGCSFKAPPYILGYTGYIPGYNSRYGLTFMKAVEEGASEWRESQGRLRARRDAMRAHAERADPRNMLARVRADNVDVEIDHGHRRPTHESANKMRNAQRFDNQVSPERPPIVGYTGHIPGAKSELALSRRYAQAAKRGLQQLHTSRRADDLSRCNSTRPISCGNRDYIGLPAIDPDDPVVTQQTIHRVLDEAHVDETGRLRP
ncbi:hypothetical protein QAD02_008716 [Eretmocerus hayati]|uniref:Uncharacterized protein n=1 Tax=Eretmocerus hayati TaxID=131215 RepID=A0ACC2N9P6_9HYME|nr:hypothetical protein QAD02_008716 [Eretmocerus hayati]